MVGVSNEKFGDESGGSSLVVFVVVLALRRGDGAGGGCHAARVLPSSISGVSASGSSAHPDFQHHIHVASGECAGEVSVHVHVDVSIVGYCKRGNRLTLAVLGLEGVVGDFEFREVGDEAFRGASCFSLSLDEEYDVLVVVDVVGDVIVNVGVVSER